VIERDDIGAAHDRIGPRVRTTPVLAMEKGAFGIDPAVRLTLKLELLQHTGSFKPRGAFNKMLASDVPTEGVVAASGGNFGLAVAYAARQLGHRAEIFVPNTSPSRRSTGSAATGPRSGSLTATSTTRSWPRPRGSRRPVLSRCIPSINRRSLRSRARSA